MQCRTAMVRIARVLLLCATWWTSSASAIIPGPSRSGPVVPHIASIESSTLMLRSAGGTACSATVIGPRTLMTAGNCIGTSGRLAASVGREEHLLECNRLTRPGEAFVDIAFCVTDATFKGLTPLRLDLNVSPSIGETVLLAGFGCSTPGGLDRSAVGRYRQEQARVAATRALLQQEVLAEAIGAAACFGDSGGGVFRLVAGSNATPVLMGVMSRSDMTQTTWFVPLSDANVKQKILRYALDAAVALCGARSDNSGCEVAGPVASGSGSGTAPPPNLIVLRPTGSSGPLAANHYAAQLVRAEGNGRETASSAFRRVCGISIESIPGITNEQALRIGGVTARRGDLLELPKCPVIAAPAASADSAPATKAVQKGDTLWSLYKDLGKSGGISPTAPAPIDFQAFVKRFGELNPKVQSSQLKIDELVRVPAVVASTEAKPAPVATTSIPDALPILSLSAAESEASCKQVTDMATYPYDLALLLDVLNMNRRVDIPPQAVAITIADSGLQGAGQGVFVQSVLSKRRLTDFHAYSKTITPQVLNAQAKTHGTAVASVALGGPLFARFGPMAANPRIQLAVHRIYFTPASEVAAAEETVTADVALFDDMIRFAEDKAAGIVNLSLRSTGALPVIESKTREPRTRLLFVAAAGNQGRRLSKEPASDLEVAYPAVYGGQSSQRLVTVLALDADGTRAKFSNWGARFVDIAAPGCRIPALRWDAELSRFVETRESGTSVAVPIVSFAAATVLSESGGEYWPEEIKRRLLVSADIDSSSQFVQEVMDGRKLNVAKAAAIRNDVLELKGRRLLIGDLVLREGATVLADPSKRLTFTCEGESDLRVPPQDLFKIARWAPSTSGTDRYRVYYRGNADELFRSDVCSKPEFTVRIVKLSGDAVDVDWRDIQDIVSRNR